MNDFNKGKWLSFYLVNQLMYKLSLLEFTEFKDKIAFQLELQAKLYNIMASTVLPSYINLLTHSIMDSTQLEDVIPRNYFESGNESMLLRLVKEKDMTKIDLFCIVLNICHTLLRIFNNITSNSFSSNLQNVIQSNLESFKTYFCSTSCTNNEILPKSKDIEILRLL